MARESREVWAKRVERLAASDLTVAEFATEIGVNLLNPIRVGEWGRGRGPLFDQIRRPWMPGVSSNGLAAGIRTGDACTVPLRCKPRWCRRAKTAHRRWPLAG